MKNVTRKSVKLPKRVESSFNRKYPSAIKRFWREDENKYRITCIHHNHLKYVDIDKNGKWLRSELFISNDALPQSVQRLINNRFGKCLINNISRVIYPLSGFSYHMIVWNGSGKMNVTIDESQEIHIDGFEYDDLSNFTDS